MHRELLFARRDRGRHTNRIKGLLASQGVPLERIKELPAHLETARLWDGSSLPPRLCFRLTREWETIRADTTRIRALKHERRELLRHSDDPAIAQVRQLHRLRGVGIDGAWLYVMEFFSWRQFQNRRQVGGLAGLTDAHYQSGDVAHQQGISKAGNRCVRALAINTAWAWLRFQPRSALARWYRHRFGKGTSRLRKIGIVALARKLLIAFWRYLAFGVVPEGAVLRASSSTRRHGIRHQLVGAARRCSGSRVQRSAPIVRRGPLPSGASLRLWRIRQVRVLDQRGRHG